MEDRKAYIDFGSGIMIIYVVLFHALQSVWALEGREVVNPMLIFPYFSFFMPWFFYKSGYFFKKQPWREQVAKDVRKLLRTFVIWSVIGYLIYLAYGILQHTLTLRSATYSVIRGLLLKGSIPINEPLWFLMTLFGVKFIWNLLLPSNDDKYKSLRIASIVLFCSIGSYMCYIWNNRLLPYWVSNCMSGLVFFVLGFWLRDYATKWWLILIGVLGYILCCIFGFSIVSMYSNTLRSGMYILWIPAALCGIITYNAACMMVYKCISFKFLEIIGKNAMIIYVSHMLIISIVSFVLIYRHSVSLIPFALWIILGSCALLIPFINVINRKIRIS